MSYPFYTRTKEVYDIEEQTGKSIEDFLDESCFDDEEDDYDCDECYE